MTQLPEAIEMGIVSIASEWERATTVGQALSTQAQFDHNELVEEKK